MKEQQTDLSSVVYQTRHAVLQTEQNALAEIRDDILRQQAGVLFGCIRNSVGLLEANVTSQVWVAQSKHDGKKAISTLKQFSWFALLLACVYCAAKSLWLPLILTVASAVLNLAVWIKERRNAPPREKAPQIRATISVDTDRLLSLLDGQMNAVERYLNDFTYLNEQLRGASDLNDPVAVARACDLLEALYECDEAQRASADEAARKLLERLGLRVLDYSEENSRFFTALPSKNMTQTLSPAILSIKDQQLLRRGTAAVRMDAA